MSVILRTNLEPVELGAIEQGVGYLLESNGVLYLSSYARLIRNLVERHQTGTWHLEVDDDGGVQHGHHTDGWCAGRQKTSADYATRTCQSAQRSRDRSGRDNRLRNFVRQQHSCRRVVDRVGDHDARLSCCGHFQ